MLFDRQFLESCHKLRKSVEISLGPHGKGVLISRKSPAEMFITKSGRDILEVFRGSHPLLDIIISSIKVSQEPLSLCAWSVMNSVVARI